MMTDPPMKTRPAASTGRVHNIFHHDFTGGVSRYEYFNPLLI